MADKYSMLAFTLDNQDKAKDLLHKLQELDTHDDNIKIKDAAFANKVSKGRVELKQSDDMGGGRGAFGGGAIGLLAGTMVAGPLGAAVGGAIGATVAGLYAKLRDSGVNDKFMKQVSEKVEEGKTVLFIMYSGEISQDMVNTMRNYNADVVHGTLPAQAEKAVVATYEAEGEEIANEIEVFTDQATEADIEPVEAVIAPIVAHAAEPPPPLPPEAAVPLAAVAAAAEAVQETPPPAPDNLTVIDGIGPKVNAALNGAGITTYSRLARASEAEMRDALGRAGMVVPKTLTTWPHQARYAAQGEWQELYKFNAKRKLAAKGLSS